MTIEKVVIYITQGEKLLVFRHSQFPEAGIQVPAGTVRVGENPLEAALREACEETGLYMDELIPYGKLGEDILQYEDDTGISSIHRHFYQFEFIGHSSNTWLHREIDPSDGSPAPIEFELYWVRHPDETPVLAGDQGIMLARLSLSD
jgi:8-oxo-dGTP pyrophosphatase MutT (NUDIX family)